MNRFCGEIYAKARISAGMTQQDAAFVVGVSVRTLSDYERGFARCPDDVVVAMIRAYKADWLGWAHLSKNNEVGAICLPAYEPKEIAQALLVMQREQRHVGDVMPKLVDVCSDGVITPDEVLDYQSAKAEINHLVCASFALMYPEKAETASVGALTASR